MTYIIYFVGYIDIVFRVFSRVFRVFHMRFSLFQPQEFWGRLARRELKWIKDFDKTMDCDMTAGKFKWFEGGILNASGELEVLGSN